ncbi:lamin tail domain-containing protein [Candidatus Campbellbacteria bacterium]|nr:MAG: lamin tail domain-containing protein [Candidatus Campbellbacteria bacterium]
MIKKIIACLCVGGMLPAVAHAQITINEIAWMGTSASANDEWIELYNSGSDSVALSGWFLKASDGDPAIALTGDIPAGGYFLLERSDDESVPGVPAGVIYTGALGNAGETLTLFDTGGVVIDSVIGGTNWSLGGDNVIKNTPQRQADNSWITGIPTPGVQNSTQPIQIGGGTVLGSSTSTSATSTASSTTKKPTVVGYVQNVFAYAGVDIQTVADAYAFLEASGVDAKGEHISATSYQWSFGDGDAGDAKETAHIYRFPGTYTAAVSLMSQYQRAQDNILVQVFPADITISSVMYGDSGFVELYNKSDRALDLSLWKLQIEYAEGKKIGHTFTFPRMTTIAPHAQVPFPAFTTKVYMAEKDRVVLYYPSGKEAAVFEGILYDAEHMNTRLSKKK